MSFFSFSYELINLKFIIIPCFNEREKENNNSDVDNSFQLYFLIYTENEMNRKRNNNKIRSMMAWKYNRGEKNI